MRFDGWRRSNHSDGWRRSNFTGNHSDGWRRSRISIKMHCDFQHISVFDDSSVSARLWDAPARITAGPLLIFGDSVTIDTGRPPSTAAISNPFLNGSSVNHLLYCSNEERSAGTVRARSRKKNHPQHPPDQKFRFFHFCKMFRGVYDFLRFVSGFCIFLVLPFESIDRTF